MECKSHGQEGKTKRNRSVQVSSFASLGTKPALCIEAGHGPCHPYIQRRTKCELLVLASYTTLPWCVKIKLSAWLTKALQQSG